jgi:hypothetical protein
MTEYRIVPHGPKGYGGELIAANRFLSVRGFTTEIDAMTWTEAQQASEPVAKEGAEWDRRAGRCFAPP